MHMQELISMAMGAPRAWPSLISMQMSGAPPLISMAGPAPAAISGAAPWLRGRAVLRAPLGAAAPHGGR